MHESSLVESLIGLVQQNAPEGRRVRSIDVRVGLLTGVSPYAMQTYFELLRDDTLGPQAELKVTLVPLQARCESCGRDHALSEAAWQCPSCGGETLSFRNGDELFLNSFEVEDAESHHDRAEDPETQQ